MRNDLVPERPEYYVQTGSMFENPYGVPHKEIVAMIQELDAEMAAQVIFGKYVESDGLVFSGKLVQMLFDRSVERIVSDRWTDKEALAEAAEMHFDHKRTTYATGVDFARINDFTVLFTLDVRFRPAKVVYYRRLNRVPWEGIYKEVGRAVQMWGPSVLADATGMAGDIILDALEERWFCPVHDRTLLRENRFCVGRDGRPLSGCKEEEMIPLNCVEGFQFTKQSKQGLIEHLRNLLSIGYQAGSDENFGWLRCPPIVQLEEELSFYSWDDKGLDTDCVMALALAAWQGVELMVGESSVGSPYGL